MEMKYVVRDEEPFAFGRLLGIQGISHIIHEGTHTNDARFTLAIDDCCGPEKLWGVVGLFQTVQLDGTPLGGNTMIVFGSTGKKPFSRFEDALAFCRAVGKDLYDKPVPSNWVDDLVFARGMTGAQWFDNPVAEPTEAGDAGDDSEGGTCDVGVEVDIPANRVLH